MTSNRNTITADPSQQCPSVPSNGENSQSWVIVPTFLLYSAIPKFSSFEIGAQLLELRKWILDEPFADFQETAPQFSEGSGKKTQSQRDAPQILPV